MPLYSAPAAQIASLPDNFRPQISDHSTRLLKKGLGFVLLSGTVFVQLGYNIGSYFLELSLISVYVLLGIMMISHMLRMDKRAALLFVAGMVCAALSLLINKGVSSPSSLALLFVMFLPYLYTLRSDVDSKALWLWFVRYYNNIALFIAIAGIIQFFAQTVIKADWLFDIKSLLPNDFRQSGYNTVIPFGNFKKSNGFFLPEPSGFSVMMAMAIIFELSIFKRMPRMAVYGLGLMLSYSGSGIAILILYSLFPLGGKSILRVSLLLAAFAAALFLFGDVLHLSQTAGRVNEFDSNTSSAYVRYIAPFRLICDFFFSDTFAPFIGHGPGTIARTVTNYAFHTPTYAKLIFEYGMFGMLTFGILGLRCLRRFQFIDGLSTTIFVVWMVLSGYLLQAGWLAFVYPLFMIWPRQPSGASFESLLTKARA